MLIVCDLNKQVFRVHVVKEDFVKRGSQQASEQGVAATLAMRGEVVCREE